MYFIVHLVGTAAEDNGFADIDRYSAAVIGPLELLAATNYCSNAFVTKRHLAFTGYIARFITSVDH